MARFRLAGGPTSIPPGGRRLRCGRCGEKWQALPVSPPAEILPPELQPKPSAASDRTEPAGSTRAAELVDEPSDVADGRRVDAGAGEGGAPERARGAARRSASLPAAAAAGRARRRAQAFLLGVLLALLAAALHYRTDVVRSVPASAGLYGLVGLQVNLRGLEFRNLSTRRISEDGLPVLIVEAEILNQRAVAEDVPAIRIAVRGSQGEELYVWTVEPRQRSIEAGGTMQVRSRLALPPSGAQDVQLRFAERMSASLGLR